MADDNSKITEAATWRLFYGRYPEIQQGIKGRSAGII